MGQGWRPSVEAWGGYGGGTGTPFPSPYAASGLQLQTCPRFDMGFKGTTGLRKWTGRENRTAVLPIGAGGAGPGLRSRQPLADVLDSGKKDP